MFVGTPFGLTPTSAVLQRTVSIIFGGFERIIPFQDDITIGSDDDNQHLDDVIAAINALSSANLRLRIEKCQFFKDTLNILGHVFTARGICIDKRKFVSLPSSRPESGKQSRTFFGFGQLFS